MEILSTSDHDLNKAAAALADGLLVAFPTETVYGLGADAFNTTALAKVFEVKLRPRFDPLIVHIAEIDFLPKIADSASLTGAARQILAILSERLWPGPLTLVLPKQKEVPKLATSGLETVAIRCPSHPVAQKLIRLSTGTVAAPSANTFGSLSPTRAVHVKASLGSKVDYIVDGGKTQHGLESTVLDIAGDIPAILRLGAVSKEAIEELIGPVELKLGVVAEKPLSPGQLKSHYAPGVPLVLHKQGELASIQEIKGEGRLYFSSPKDSKAHELTRVLSQSGDLVEADANLFDMLHDLDALGLSLIRAEEAPSYGLGAAINDRLRRAASSTIDHQESET